MGAGGDFKELSDKVGRIDKRLIEVEKSLKNLPWWFIGTGATCLIGGLAISVAIIVGFANMQSDRIGEALQGHREVIEKDISAMRESIQERTDQFQRENERNYDLALRALERSIAAETKERPAE